MCIYIVCVPEYSLLRVRCSRTIGITLVGKNDLDNGTNHLIYCSENYLVPSKPSVLHNTVVLKITYYLLLYAK